MSPITTSYVLHYAIVCPPVRHYMSSLSTFHVRHYFTFPIDALHHSYAILCPPSRRYMTSTTTLYVLHTTLYVLHTDITFQFTPSLSFYIITLLIPPSLLITLPLASSCIHQLFFNAALFIRLLLLITSPCIYRQNWPFVYFTAIDFIATITQLWRVGVGWGGVGDS